MSQPVKQVDRKSFRKGQNHRLEESTLLQLLGSLNFIIGNQRFTLTGRI